jgi:ABC-type antimicrobial peptide transport system permease subunit
MTIQEWGALGEMIGGIAIVFSLIYVGAQIRQNTKATKSATANATIATTTAWYTAIGNNKQSSTLMWNYFADPYPLSPEEKLQFVMNLHGLFMSFQNSYYLVTEGTLEKRIQESMTEVIVGVKDQPGFQLFWEQRKSIFFKEFRDYVESILITDRQVSVGLFKKLEPE